jgi:type IV pilus assembly protein PilB
MVMPAAPPPVIPVVPQPSVNGNGAVDLHTMSSVADILLTKKIITPEQLDQAKADSVNSGQEVEEVLVDKGLVDQEQFARAKAEYFHIEFVKLSEVGVAPEALNVVPEGLAQRYLLLPFSIDKANNALSVAMANPMDLRAIDFVEKKTGFRLVPHMAVKTELEAAITERYTQSLSTEVTAALRETSMDRRKVVDVKQLGEVIREAPIAKIVETILTFAMKARASDIHIEPQTDKTRVRYRIDGILHEKLVLPKGVQDAVVSRIKIIAELKIDEKRLPQDGRFTFRANDEEIDLRVSSLPTVHGEKVVMRLLKKSTAAVSLKDLGLRGMAIKHLEQSIVVPYGIVLITGPTGSGKTTTLYSILTKISTPRVNIVTIEDPVEYEILGVNQVQVNVKAGLTFASGLRSFLRQDPNIIMVGEIRDKETADLAIQASLTGHLVFSTLHTNSAAGALPRLMDMEAEPFLLASSMTCVVAQRVVRKICPHCKKAYTPEPAVVENFHKVLGPLFDAYLRQKQLSDESLQIFKGEGCEDCNDSGYTGRVGVFEVLPVSEQIGRLILERRPAVDVEKQAIAEGMILMKQDGYLKVLEGLTTIEEVLRVAET